MFEWYGLKWNWIHFVCWRGHPRVNVCTPIHGIVGRKGEDEGGGMEVGVRVSVFGVHTLSLIHI